MPRGVNKGLRIEISKNNSGKLKGQRVIKSLKPENYQVYPFDLDGDAPKQFIRAYFYNYGGEISKDNRKSWKSYIAKTAEKWYPHESIIEFLINRIGQVLDLNMNQIKLVKANSQIRFLSEYFLNRKEDIMIHGAEICGEYLEDEEFAKEIANDKNTARELFNFQFIAEAMKSIFPNNYKELLVELVKLIVFDAITGNNDRHFYNWAVIRSVQKTSKNPYFAPFYDSARGLMWNWSDEELKRQYRNHFNKGKKVAHYINSASPRISIEGNSNINHFDLVAYLYTNFNEYQETIMALISLRNEQKVLKMYAKEFSRLFIYERNQLVNLVIKTRFNKLREVTSNK